MWRRRVRRRLLCHSKRKRTPSRMVLFLLERATRLELASRPSREWLLPFAGPLASPRIRSRLRRGGWRQRVRRDSSSSQKEKDTLSDVLFLWSGQRGSNSLPAIPRMAVAIRRTPGSPRIRSRLRRGGGRAASSAGLIVIPKGKGHPLGCPFPFGAGNEARTRYLHLGKVALYQMSYARGTRGILTEKYPLVKPLLQDFPRRLFQRPLTPLPPPLPKGPSGTRSGPQARPADSRRWSRAACPPGRAPPGSG